MPKRYSSTNGWLSYALDLARKKSFSRALEVLGKVSSRKLDSNSLRLAAQVNNRCGVLVSAERYWLEIEKREEMEPGDYYMLGSLQMRLSKFESAVRCFEREIEISTRSGDDYFLGVSVTRLAYLKLKLNDYSAARKILERVTDSSGDYMDDFGFRTKVDILREIDLAEEKNGTL